MNGLFCPRRLWALVGKPTRSEFADCSQLLKTHVLPILRKMDGIRGWWHQWHVQGYGIPSNATYTKEILALNLGLGLRTVMVVNNLSIYNTLFFLGGGVREGVALWGGVTCLQLTVRTRKDATLSYPCRCELLVWRSVFHQIPMIVEDGGFDTMNVFLFVLSGICRWMTQVVIQNLGKKTPNMDVYRTCGTMPGGIHNRMQMDVHSLKLT